MDLHSLTPSGILKLAGDGGANGKTARVLLEGLFGQGRLRDFAVRTWDGVQIGGSRRRDFTLVFRDRSTFLSLLASREPTAFADAYVGRRIDIEGDVDAAIALTQQLHAARSETARRLTRLLSRLERRVRARDGEASDPRALDDLPDDFFKLFLDERMVHSCAYFADPAASLEKAQARKLDLVCKKLQLRPGDLFLDVGCGWGALLIWAARRYGARAHGITPSRRQAEAARARVARAGLSGCVTIEERSYADLPEAAFDKIASIGMIEHVGIANYDAYFAMLARALRPGGLLLNHGITRPAGADLDGDFILGRVLPGAQLDVLSHTLTVMEERGFEILDVQSLRPHYALTFAAWAKRFAANREQAARLVPLRVLRTWDLYLPGCRRAFAEGVASVHQCLAAKPPETGEWTVPLTREQLMEGARA
jgi:cyclopropane-fatty-acyl-phospholipid synthase